MPEPLPTLKRPSKAIWIVPLLAILVAGGVFWWRRGHQPVTHGVAPAPAAPSTAGSPAAPASPTVAPPADLDRTRKLLEAFSSDPRFRSWLAPGEWIRRWVILTDNVAEGVSPRKQLAFLAPHGTFAVVQKEQETIIDPSSYRRYDGFADVVAKIDAQAVAKAYRELHAAVEGAYRALGYPEASLDHVTANALRRIEEAPVVDGDIAVKGDRGLFVFVDPKLEKLSEIDKHLLRMGPRNTRTIQVKVREIDRALSLPPATPGR